MRRIARHFRHAALFLLGVDPSFGDVRHEPPTEIVHADAGIDDGEDDQNHRNHGEGRQIRSEVDVLLLLRGLIHPDQLEQEIGQAGKVQDLKVSK